MVKRRKIRAGAWCLVLAVASVGMGSALQAQTHEGVELVNATLLADSETVAPGRPVTLGLHLKMAPGWHTYWEYAGDSGMPTNLELELPEGFRATAIQWPLPERSTEPGGLKTYAYKDEVLLLVRIFPPATLEGEKVRISGKADWLVCEAVCLPGQADVFLTLRVADEPVPVNQKLFQRFQDKLPQRLRGSPDDPVSVKWEREEDELHLVVQDSAEGVDFDFYPLPPRDVVVGHPETSSRNGRSVIRIPLAAAPAGLSRLPGVLIASPGEGGERQGWFVLEQ